MSASQRYYYTNRTHKNASSGCECNSGENVYLPFVSSAIWNRNYYNKKTTSRTVLVNQNINLPKVQKSSNCTNADVKVHLWLNDKIPFSNRLEMGRKRASLSELPTMVVTSKQKKVSQVKRNTNNHKSQTSRISNANLPSHILTRMQSLSFKWPLVGNPGSLMYISIKFWTELHILLGSRILRISW